MKGTAQRTCRRPTQQSASSNSLEQALSDPTIAIWMQARGSCNLRQSSSTQFRTRAARRAGTTFAALVSHYSDDMWAIRPGWVVDEIVVGLCLRPCGLVWVEVARTFRLLGVVFTLSVEIFATPNQRLAWNDWLLRFSGTWTLTPLFAGQVRSLRGSLDWARSNTVRTAVI